VGIFGRVPPLDASSFLAGAAAAGAAVLAIAALVRGRRHLRRAAAGAGRLAASLLEPLGRGALALAAAARGAAGTRAAPTTGAATAPGPAVPPPLAPPDLGAPAPVEPFEDGGGAPALASAADALREPLGRAAASASYVRLLAPPLPPRAGAALDGLERALEDLSRRLAALAAAAGSASGPRTLALAPLLRDLLAAFSPPPGVAVRAALPDVSARADDRSLRAALRELLRAAAAAPGPGGALEVALALRGSTPVVEIACGGSRGDGAAALARALVGPHGGHVEEEAAPGGARTLRVVLARADDPRSAAVPVEAGG
jgi:hypothetical protein